MVCRSSGRLRMRVSAYGLVSGLNRADLARHELPCEPFPADVAVVAARQRVVHQVAAAVVVAVEAQAAVHGDVGRRLMDEARVEQGRVDAHVGGAPRQRRCRVPLQQRRRGTDSADRASQAAEADAEHAWQSIGWISVVLAHASGRSGQRQFVHRQLAREGGQS